MDEPLLSNCVKDLVTSEGQWNWDLLHTMFPVNVLFQLAALIVLPTKVFPLVVSFWLNMLIHFTH